MPTCQGYADAMIYEFCSINSEVSPESRFQRCKDKVMTVSGGNIKFIAEEVPNCNIMTLARPFNFCQSQHTKYCILLIGRLSSMHMWLYAIWQICILEIRKFIELII